uniref:Cilia- and flagella-associated protein 52 n=1 Tax=Oncorhynchus kisutch TaxID=8019 RepID=A0A8C7CK72_ONCKI
MSATLILNSGAPQGCVLSPLLYSLFTHDCVAKHDSNTSVKFADDTIHVFTIFGGTGHIFSGLRVHPDREHLIYPLGCTVILKSLKDGKQEFLHGHTNNVSCVTVSKSGRYIASGQADLIIWDYEKRAIHARLQLHKAKVEGLAFSPNDKYLVSLGGQDDGSIEVWNLESKEAICGSPATTLGCYLPNRKIRPTECQTGQLKRIVNCIEIPDDLFFYCGTTSGDILKVNLKARLLNSCRPRKQKFSKGVNTLKVLKSGDILVGSGDGMFTLCSGPNFKTIKKVELEGGLTSIAVRGEGHQFFAGTEAAQIYSLGYTDIKEELIATSHNMTPLKIQMVLANTLFSSVCYHPEEYEIITSGTDRKIGYWEVYDGSAIRELEGSLSGAINGMHISQDGQHLVTGGDEKLVKVWDYSEGELTQVGVGHSGSITSIKISANNRSMVSTSVDGAVLRWRYPHPSSP